MILGENIGSVYSGGKEIQRVFSYGKLVWEKKTQDDDIDYSTTPFTVKAVEGVVRVSVGKRNPDNGNIIYIDMKYSINGGKWITTNSLNAIELNKNDSVSIIATDADYCTVRGETYYVYDTDDPSRYETKRRLSDISGNIMSLIYGDNFIGQDVWTERNSGSSGSGFFSRSDIRNAENLILPATTLSERAYRYMFSQCIWLVSAPELPATTLSVGCYVGMFYNCPSLTKAPILPAPKLVKGCYGGMFAYCESLKYVKCYATSLKIYSIDKMITYYDDIYGVWVESNEWLSGITTSGTLVCKQVNGGKNPLEDYIPSTWSVEYFT